MAIIRDDKKEDAEKDVADPSADEPGATDRRSESPSAPPAEPQEDALARASDDSEEHHDIAPVGAVASPTQLGTKRFVYAAYFAGAIAIAFLMSKLLDFTWFKLQNYKPAIGEPRDEIVMPLSALIGAGAAVYYWFRTRARQLAEEVATEMAKVTWPSRTEVTNGTFVVIVTTLVSTVFFALMDRFWSFVTNLVYGG
jgi:preprotein translocase subunit SecE